MTDKEIKESYKRDGYVVGSVITSFPWHQDSQYVDQSAIGKEADVLNPDRQGPEHTAG